ncbi:trypsin-like serine protease [Streptomyces novaecaesareae]|uniref:trypsin-like serine protease n=1 Tax=Streptomyces novaecaesareae TaxID=68244 RepID=UPI00099884F4|nr:trypsin-like serine protease [Streptomyces novaecaesareae]
MLRKSSSRSQNRRAGVLAAAVAAGTLTTFSGAPAGAVTGDAAADGTYTATARLVIGDNLRACTGALVDRYWVVTAASCFADDPAQPQALAAGAPKWKTTAGIAGISAQVAELVPRQDRDLVMARLAAPVDGITPLALATTAPTAGQTLRVPGFGRTKDEWAPLKLHTGAFSLDTVSPTGIGTTGTGGAAICKGDTGAPAIRETGGKAELVAVASRSWQGGCLGTPATETRTGAYNTRVDDLGAWVKDLRFRTAEVKAGTHVQAIGSDSTLWDTVADYKAGRWQGSWSPVTGGTLTAVDSVAIGDTVHVFAVGADGKVYTRDGKVGGSWTPLGEVPGGAGGARGITAAARGNTVSLQIIGSDGSLYSTYADYAAGSWATSWEKVGTNNLKAITSATTADSVVHVFAINEDGRVYTRDNRTDGSWTPWGELPGNAVDVKGITAAARGNTVDLQIIGADGSLYTTYGYFDLGRWESQWAKVSDNHLKAISSSAEGNVVHVVAVNEDDKVYNRDADYNAGKWTAWGEIPGGATNVKAVTAATTG